MPAVADPSAADLAGAPQNLPSQPTRTFGPVEASDARRQAGFQMAADEPEDINANALFQKSQMLTLDVIGKGFANHNTRLEMMQEQFFARLGKT